MNKVLIALMLAACLLAATVRAAAPPQPAAPTSLSFNRDNSVHGLKEDQLYAYVDLAGDAAALQKAKEDAIVAMVLKAAVEAASKWWTEPKFSKADHGVVDVITILNKDEYARADFSSALMHGKVFLKRVDKKVTVERHTLTFANLRQAHLK